MKNIFLEREDLVKDIIDDSKELLVRSISSYMKGDLSKEFFSCFHNIHSYRNSELISLWLKNCQSKIGKYFEDAKNEENVNIFLIEYDYVLENEDNREPYIDNKELKKTNNISNITWITSKYKR